MPRSACHVVIAHASPRVSLKHSLHLVFSNTASISSLSALWLSHMPPSGEHRAAVFALSLATFRFSSCTSARFLSFFCFRSFAHSRVLRRSSITARLCAQLNLTSLNRSSKDRPRAFALMSSNLSSRVRRDLGEFGNGMPAGGDEAANCCSIRLFARVSSATWARACCLRLSAPPAVATAGSFDGLCGFDGLLTLHFIEGLSSLMGISKLPSIEGLLFEQAIEVPRAVFFKLGSIREKFLDGRCMAE